MAENRDIQQYLDNIGSQHKTKPKYMALVTALLNKVDSAHATAKSLPASFNVHEAIGKQLDIIGSIVGVSREFPPMDIPDMPSKLDDASYRQIIQSKIIQNQWDGSYGAFVESYKNSLTSGLTITYHDNQDMTVSCNVVGMPSPIVTALILGGYIVPKPAGVRMDITITTEPEANPNAATYIVAVGNAAYISSCIE